MSTYSRYDESSDDVILMSHPVQRGNESICSAKIFKGSSFGSSPGHFTAIWMLLLRNSFHYVTLFSNQTHAYADTPTHLLRQFIILDQSEYEFLFWSSPIWLVNIFDCKFSSRKIKKNEPILFLLYSRKSFIHQRRHSTQSRMNHQNKDFWLDGDLSRIYLCYH